ncbi:hypothetical protein L3081_07765 [Colwellia sp. MSW7]|uniref:MarR family transcriptional regulator n=1 Tax=Colwellia maritima TaxID=2912588 RepID=A0ABS9X0M5_9GAMM|nr:hypothetical protein [Colwellia maritima]MCI2283317.1 hypothetical protein [Colwellia maritima]
MSQNKFDQLVIEINALYLAIVSTYKLDHLINEIGIIYLLSYERHIHP